MNKSEEIFERAKKLLPMGVSYRIRSFPPHPIYFSRAEGSRLWDVDGLEYTDYWCGHFALILGHNHPQVLKALEEQVGKGIFYGLEHELIPEVAGKVVAHLPSAEMVRFTSSGTEANMYAIRLARTATKRSMVCKFQGGWHGGYDSLDMGMGGGVESGGILNCVSDNTLILPFNDLEGTAKTIKNCEEEIACIIVEPVLGAGGIIPGEMEFLKGLREISQDNGIVLIFDEVITGFRFPGGAQSHYGVSPDVTTLGKTLGGGLPIGAIAGRKELMERMDDLKFSGDEYSFQGGTFTAHPLSLAAGSATLNQLDSQLYAKVDGLGERVRKGAEEIGIETTGIGSLFCMHMERSEPIFQDLLKNGIMMLKPSMLHGAISSAHSSEDVEKLLGVLEESSS